MGVSPGFTPRPSLSEERLLDRIGLGGGVAGVHAPAFVERMDVSLSWRLPASRVAGVHAPAFVERVRTSVPSDWITRWCRRGSRPGLR